MNNNYIIENGSYKINNYNDNSNNLSISRNNENIEELKKNFNKELKIKEDMIEQLQNELNNKNVINKNNCNKIYNHKEYIILSDKHYKNLHWFLLAKKLNSKENIKMSFNEKNKINNELYTYENVFWVDENHIEEEINKFNNFENENEEENKIIMNYIKKLEEKENIISKLTLRISSIEKTFNNKSTINNEKISSKNRSKSSNSKPLNDINLFEKEDEKQTEEYKESDKIEENNKKSTYGSMDIEHKYYNIEEELKATKNQIQIYKKILKDLESKISALKESCKNFFSKVILSKIEKEEVKQILKMFEFNNNEINLIVNKKRNK